jgi:hypothetical protein
MRRCSHASRRTGILFRPRALRLKRRHQSDTEVFLLGKRTTQNPVLARVCGFEPLRRHSLYNAVFEGALIKYCKLSISHGREKHTYSKPTRNGVEPAQCVSPSERSKLQNGCGLCRTSKTTAQIRKVVFGLGYRSGSQQPSTYPKSANREQRKHTSTWQISHNGIAGAKGLPHVMSAKVHLLVPRKGFSYETNNSNSAVICDMP